MPAVKRAGRRSLKGKWKCAGRGETKQLLIVQDRKKGEEGRASLRKAKGTIPTPASVMQDKDKKEHGRRNAAGAAMTAPNVTGQRWKHSPDKAESGTTGLR